MIQPYRTNTSEDEENFNTIYEGLFIGTESKPYLTEVEIDEFNDTGIKTWRCTCKDFQMRNKSYPETCKHINEFLKILAEFIKWPIDT